MGLTALADKASGFKGRLRRRDCWLIGIVLGVIELIVVEVVTVRFFGPEYGVIAAVINPMAAPVVPLSLVTVQTLLDIPALWSSFVVTAKRFRDQDKSPTWGFVAWTIAVVPIYVLPFLTPLWSSAAVMFVPTFVPTLVGLISLLAVLYVVVVAGFMDGTPGPNRFGPSPKAKEFAKVS